MGRSGCSLPGPAAQGGTRASKGTVRDLATVDELTSRESVPEIVRQAVGSGLLLVERDRTASDWQAKGWHAAAYITGGGDAYARAAYPWRNRLDKRSRVARRRLLRPGSATVLTTSSLALFEPFFSCRRRQLLPSGEPHRRPRRGRSVQSSRRDSCSSSRIR